MSCFVVAFPVGSGCNKDTQVQRKHKVAIVFPVTIDAFERFRMDFEKQLDNANVSSAVLSAEGDPSKFDSVIEQALRVKPDILVAIGTQLTNTAFGPQFRERLPKVVASCISAPRKVESLTSIGLTPPRKAAVAIVSDNPDRNIYLQSAQIIAKAIGTKQIIGILYNEGEINSKSTALSLKSALTSQGLKTVPGLVSGPNDVAPVTESLLLRGSSCIVIPHDKAATTEASAIVKICNEFRDKPVVVFALDDGTVRKNGAAIGVSVSYSQLGQMTADTCLRILNGDDPAKMPITTQKEARVYVNKTSLQKCGISLDAEFLKNAVIYE
ncbi:MAG: hypothetical protein MI923_22445 [Phycisphaerales bacterium]|nr:hypothetical protein [Phycisphaerales bacterium]